MHRKTLVSTAASLLFAMSLSACGGDDDDGTPPVKTVPVGDTVALTASGKLVSFDRAAPATQVGSVTLSGLASGEALLGIDTRPADGKLYALGSTGNLYTIEASTGVATLAAALRAAAGDDNPFTALSGDNFGVDFNPVADRLRVVSDSGLNLRINVDTGDTTTDGTIAAAAGRSAISAVAYTNSFAGAAATQLFDIDAAAGLLHRQDPPNAGTLAAGAALGVKATLVNGFDIDSSNNAGYAALTVANTTSLYKIDLATGAATVVDGGAVAGGEAIRGLALAQSKAPTALGLTADNQLVAFDPAKPSELTATTAITGLGAGEVVVGIDTRPKDGLLYALARTSASAGKLYTVDAATGAATFVADLVANSTDTSDGNAPYSTLAGNAFSVDFNPVADRLRVVSDSGQNLRIAVETVTGTSPATAGATITDLDLNRAAPASVIAAAYTNSFAGATATALYDLDGNADVLTQQLPPNAGTLVDVGALGVDAVGSAGFDIGGGGNGLALAALRSAVSGPFTLYTVSLETGAATRYRDLGPASAQIGGRNGPANLIDLAIRF